MTSSPPPDDPLGLGTRAGLPDALRCLLADYPRDGWPAHRDFHGLAAFWLDRFPISRADHEARVAARAARGDLQADNPLDEAMRADPDAHGITP